MTAPHNAFRRLIWLMTGLPLLTCAPLLHANGMRLVSQDALAAARGEAFVATADNASAVHYNPAGLTLLEGHQFRSGVYGLYFEPTFQPPAGALNSGTEYGIRQNYVAVPQLFYSYSPPENPFSFGVGLYSPHGAAVEWPQNTGFRAVATEGELTYLRLNPVIAYQVTPCFSIAGGLMLDYGDISLQQGVSGRTSRANYFLFEGDDLNVGYNLGALWQPMPELSLGATLRSGTSLNFEGRTELQPFFGRFESFPATAEYHFPITAVFGISYRPTPKWNFEIDIDYTEWSSVDDVTIRQDGIPRNTLPDIPVTLRWKDSWILKVGATRYFQEGWHGSVGYVFSGNSVPDGFYSPLIADLDRHFLSFGIGKEGERFDFDAAYQFGFAADHTVTGSQPSSLAGFAAGQSADGTYDFTSHALVVSVGMKF